MEENAQPDFSTQLSCFFSDWVKVDQQQDEVIQEQPLYIDSAALESFFQDFDKAAEPIREARGNGLLSNVWQAAGLGAKEVRNSQVLKWFLDWRGDHGQGNKVLVKFLKLLPEEFHCKPERYFSTAECCPLGKQDNRVDIEIDAQEFLLFIEVKINATEGEDQLQRYIDIVKAKAGNRNWHVVYLTKDGKLPEKYKNQGNLKGISWRKVTEKFTEYAEQEDINNRGAWLAKQFADHIKTF